MTKRFRLLKWGGVCGEASSDAETYGPSKTVVEHQLPTQLINSLKFETKYLTIFLQIALDSKNNKRSEIQSKLNCKCLCSKTWRGVLNDETFGLEFFIWGSSQR